jgi:hypothetical protein
MRFLEDQLVGRDLISRDDLNLLSHATSIDEAIEELTCFYRNYQSLRHDGGLLILRMLRLPPELEIARLATAFADIAGPRGIRVSEPSEHEVSDGDHIDLARLAVDFNQRSMGRLRRLIDELNHF